MNILVTADLAVFVEELLGDVAFGELEVAGTLGLCAVEGAYLAYEALAEVFKTSADGEAVLGEGALGAAVDDLEEEFAHGGVDGVADEVGVEGLEDGLAGKDLSSHGG